MRTQESPASPRERTAPAAAEYIVRPVGDREAIRRLLLPALPYAAYAVGQLEPSLYPLSRWWVAKGPAGWGLVMHSAGGLGNALVTLGQAGAVEAVLRLHPGPRQTFVTGEVHHRESLNRHYHMMQDTTMMRMVATRQTFRRREGAARRLTGADARAVNRLYRSDGAASFYSPHQLDDAVYFGVFADGRLVSVAGTHVVSPTYGIGVVGNVYTTPAYRGLGYATVATGAVTEAVLARCGQAVLSVDPGNTPAVAAYQALGYRQDSQLLESAAICKTTSSAAAGARRLLAAVRGRRYGAELLRIGGGR